MNNVVSILKALSDETRLRIINLLLEKELCVCDINETLKITQTKASRHLSYLKNAGLVTDRKQAQWVYYSLVQNEVRGFLVSLIHDMLRCNEMYQKDLRNLEHWLKHKGEICK